MKAHLNGECMNVSFLPAVMKDIDQKDSQESGGIQPCKSFSHFFLRVAISDIIPSNGVNNKSVDKAPQAREKIGGVFSAL